ncbi:MAG: type II secretion system F family protein [Hespellia sp.]|nr:type II secretion system F family protein [Hespellia sp.]
MKPLSNLETAAFCNQMAMILKSGISALEGISILLEDAESPDENELLTQIYDEMLETGFLAPSLKKTGVYPAYLVQMTQIGEETGTLDEVMDALDSYYSREESIKKSIHSALTYPSIMIVMMLLVILVLITKVMPIFNQVFLQLGREMTGFSKGVLNLGTLFSRYSLVFIFIAIIIVLSLVLLFKTKKGHDILINFLYKMRFSQNIYDKISASRFASVMNLTLRSGMSVERGLEFSQSLIDNRYFLDKIKSCQDMIENGEDFSQALQSSKIFTGVYARMISISSRAGTMDETMGKIAVRYEADVDTLTTQLISSLEPTIVIILSVVVGVILFSVMLPLLGIMSGL